ncbi:hypothetical protein H0H92_004931 [Tricholoma furcatifolium]|nr:hypothetical protein H0H92_004931 [Tricholoma furcatifolium]
MDGVDTPLSLLELTESALEANKAHQYALTRHAERLTAELQELDRLMSAVTTEDIEDESGDTEIQVPGAIKPMGPCSVVEFLNPVVKNKELDALAEAVRQENLRLKAYAAQQNPHNEIELDTENNTEGINWSVVAENLTLFNQVSNTSGSMTRTADQCRIKWLGDRHPKINHDNWSQSELEKLKELVSAQTQNNPGKVDWVQIAHQLGTNRTPLDCMRRGVVRQRHVWNADADQRLADAVKFYGTYNWNIVARYVSEDVTASQCQVRYSRAIDPSRKRGAWTDDEFARLKVAVAAYGHSWVDVATCMPGRSNEQCRDRWTEHLSLASANTVWSEADDQILEAAVAEIGTRWKDVSVRVANGTTGQQCRTRWEKLKRLKDQQAAAAAAAAEASFAGPSAPVSENVVSTTKPSKGRPRKVVDFAGVSPNQSQQDATTAETQAGPNKRPIKKGKGKEKATVEVKKRATNDADEDIQVPAKKKRKIDESHVPLSIPLRRGPPRGKANQPSDAPATAPAKPADSTTTSTPALTAPRPKPRPRGRKKVAEPGAEEVTSNVTSDAPITPAVEGSSQSKEDGVAPDVGELDDPKEGEHSEPELTVKVPRGRGRGRPRGRRGRRGGRTQVTAVPTHEEMQTEEDVDIASSLNGELVAVAASRASTSPEPQIPEEKGNEDDERMAVDDEK